MWEQQVCGAIYEAQIVTFMPRAIPATPPTHVGMLQDLNHTQDTPNKAEIHLWTHGDDEDDATIWAMLDTPEDAEELEDAEEPEDAEESEDAEEDLEDARHLYRMVTSGPFD